MKEQKKCVELTQFQNLISSNESCIHGCGLFTGCVVDGGGLLGFGDDFVSSMAAKL